LERGNNPPLENPLKKMGGKNKDLKRTLKFSGKELEPLPYPCWENWLILSFQGIKLKRFELTL